MRSVGSSQILWPVLALLLLIATPYQAFSATNSTAVSEVKIKSYKEWKSEKVQDAISRVTMTRTQLQINKIKDPNLSRTKGSLEASSGVSIERLEAQLRDDQSDLETAKNFSVTDYLAGYLMKIQNKKAAFNEVAGKLTAEEIAELMSAYANSAFGNHGGDLAPSANSSPEDRVR